MELEPSVIIEYGAYGVMLYLFIVLIKFLCKDLRNDLADMTNIIKQDCDNTERLNTSISNHLTHAVKDLTKEVKNLGDKIDKKFP